MYSKRNVLVIINPHGGSTKALSIWEQSVKPFFLLVNMRYHFQTTNYAYRPPSLSDLEAMLRTWV